MARTIIAFDYAIKTVLRDKANFDVLSGFLTELLEKPVEVLELLESESNTESPLGKINRTDLKAKISGNEIAVFEIQFLDQIDFLGKILFNACKAVVEQVAKGQPFAIKKVYSVNIAYCKAIEKEVQKEYVFRATLSKFQGVHFDEHIPFSQNLNPLEPATDLHPEYFMILPNKFDEQMRGKFDEWVYTLKTSTVKSDFTAAGLQAAAEKLDVLKMTDEERAAYNKYQEAIANEKSILLTARLDGIEEGKAEEKIAIAKEMLADGEPLEKIVKYTGLTMEQLTQIKGG